MNRHMSHIDRINPVFRSRSAVLVLLMAASSSALLTVPCLPACAQPAQEQRQAPFVFEGRVEATTTRAEIPEPGQYVEVRVVRVLRLLGGGDLKEYLADSEPPLLAVRILEKRPEVGRSYVFSTRLEKILNDDRVPFVMAEMEEHYPARSRPEDVPEDPAVEFRRRFVAAEFVIVGTVEKVEVAEPDARITFSAPQWQRATIKVTKLFRHPQDEEPPEELTIWFPGNRDVAWRDWPKFEAGSTGIWLAQTWHVVLRQTVGTRAEPRPGVYAVSDIGFVPAPREDAPDEDVKAYEATLRQLAELQRTTHPFRRRNPGSPSDAPPR